MIRKMLQTGLAAVAMSFSAMTFATPITGEVHFAGQATLDAAPSSATAVSSFGAVLVTQGTGSYTGLTPFVDTATFKPFSFSPFVSNNPLWSVDGTLFSFDLNNVSTVSYNSGTGVLEVAGTGMLHNGTPADDTLGFWSMSTNGSTANITFSSHSIPEPSVLALAGLGMVGFGLVGFRRRNSADAVAA